MNNVTVIGRAGEFNVAFQSSTLSNHAGIVLLRELAQRLGVAAQLDDQLQVKERARGYTEAESLLALVWSQILGGSCLSDLNVLRGDQGTQALLGLTSVIAPTTAGEFLRKFDLGQITALRHELSVLAARVRPWQQSETVTLDFDPSIYEQCSTRKQGSRKAYNGQVGYAPLFCFWAEEQELLYSHLLAGNRNPVRKLLWFWREVQRRLPPGRRVKARGDSAFYHWKFIEALEAAGVTYGITADQTTQLLAQVTALPAQAWHSFGSGTQAQVAEFWYAPDRQPRRRYVVKREPRKNKKGQGYWHYHVVVTNDLHSTPRQLMRWALKRCTVENLIKEHKTGFGLAKMPTNNYFANWAWLLLGELAFNLVAWFKRLILPEPYHQATIKTIRHHLLNVAGKIVTSGKQFFLMLSEHSFYQDVWAFALKRLADMRSS
jgi:hypothetical protein